MEVNGTSGQNLWKITANLLEKKENYCNVNYQKIMWS